MEVFVYFIVSRQLVQHVKPRNLDSEVQISRRVLEFVSSNRGGAGIVMVHLGCLLQERFFGLVMPRLSGEQGELDNLNETIDCLCVALELELPPEMLYHCFFLLCNAYHMRYRVHGRQNDPDDAFHFIKLAGDVVNSQDPNLLSLKSGLMNSRYETTEDVRDLDAAIEYSSRAIVYSSRAIDRSRANHELLLERPSQLAGQLSLRFTRSGRVEDLTEATGAAQRVVDLLPPKDPSLVRFLTFLGEYELQQGWVLQDEETRQRGLRHIREAESIAKDNPETMEAVCNDRLDLKWARMLIEFNEGSLGEQELEKAITLLRDETTCFFATGVKCKNALCKSLLKRWERTHNKEDLNEAINIAHHVIELSTAPLNSSAIARGNLGRSLYQRHKSTGDSEDLQQALAVLLEAFHMTGGRPTVRIDAAILAMNILCELNDWVRARKLSLEMMDLFVILNGPALNWQDKQHLMREFSFFAGPYASIALEAGCNVLQVIDTLETCRGAILGHLIDINDLAEVSPDKAQHFRTLQNEINTVIDPSEILKTLATQTTRKIQVEEEIRACLAEIRAMEGFHKFLLGPTQEDLRAAAACGPIIIVNITRLRSDAIIITADDSIPLFLPCLEFQKVAEYIKADLTNFCFGDAGQKNKKYRELQKWLWENCVKLILEKLDNLNSSPKKHRVWWMGIGIASSLPFHAAGIYTGRNKATALSRAVSTYTSTLKVLIHGRRKVSNDSSKQKLQSLTRKVHALNSQPRLAVIAMPSTPGMLDLKGVELEAKEVLMIVENTFSTRMLLQPSAKETMPHMAECEVVHFACHGESTLPDSSSSHRVLQISTPDSAVPVVDKLTLRDVAAFDLSCGKLAFPSACSTAQNRSSDLWDEALHLVSGFQVAGYLHVIRNLWPSDDEVSAELVKGFYEYLVAAGEFGNGDNVAEALKKALSDIARKYAELPLCWAQFVHFGV